MSRIDWPDPPQRTPITWDPLVAMLVRQQDCCREIHTVAPEDQAQWNAWFYVVKHPHVITYLSVVYRRMKGSTERSLDTVVCEVTYTFKTVVFAYTIIWELPQAGRAERQTVSLSCGADVTHEFTDPEEALQCLKALMHCRMMYEQILRAKHHGRT